MDMEKYLTVLTDQIRCQTARAPIREELQAHLEDQKEAFLDEGMESQEAEKAAVFQMGDPVAVGEELNRIHRPKLPWQVLLFAAALGGVGLLLQCLIMQRFECLPWTADIDYGTQFLFLAASAAVMITVCYADYSRIGKYAKQGYVILTVFFIAALEMAEPVFGSRQWFTLPFGRVVNLRMFLFFYIPLYAAILYQYRRRRCGRIALAAIGWALPPLLLAVRIPSMFAMAVLFLSFLGAFTISVIKGWYHVSAGKVLGITYGGIAALFAAAMGIAARDGGLAYSMEKLREFSAFDFAEKWQAETLRQVLAQCRWIGAAPKGALDTLGNNVSMVDYTFVYVIATFGIAVGILLAALILALLLIFLFLTLRQKNQLGMLMGAACCLPLFLQFVLYIMGNLGINSLGNYCPFLTYGGNGMLVTYMMCGLMMSAYRRRDIFPERELERRREMI